ncbi:Diguanylate cyclase [Parafrankia sp. Ea1.12]|uniref:GGDEF domain-containing protein n=1 Tax=Parafrankia sp. Ea1.12 TaxID=573499 RepID=UPI000DA4838D|nr:GGDEF domain-containing protein [Parafrankia sp. Ea1.12]SQD95292.1 Diguanylate cyclase [Parafrankia sp. Ea1.12]
MSELRGVTDATHDLRRSTVSGRTPQLLWCAAVAAVVLFALEVALAVLLGPRPGVVATMSLNAAAQVAAAAACFWTARRTCPGDRRWRRLIGVMAGSSALASVATATAVLGGESPRVSSGWYAVLLVFHGVALAGLLSLPTDPVDGRAGMQGRGSSRWYVITMLDCVLIVGSIVLLEWGTVLAAVVRTGAPDLREFLLSLVHSVSVLILVTAVVLIASFRRPRSPATLALLGTGLLAYGLTSNVFVYRVAQHQLDMPPLSVVTFGLAFLLVFLAALLPFPARAPPDGPAPAGPQATWAYAVLPYAVLGAAGLLVVGKLSIGTQVDRFETCGIAGLLLVALVRQMVTLVENARLLAGIRDQERELHHQAFHDPLTGLANRALFTRRLQRALTRNPDDPDDPDDAGDAGDAGDGTSLSVLFLDLDEFKHVNDTFGHAAGDELLRISAERLRAGTRTVDTVARLGGDEFAVILDGDGLRSPRRVGERLAAAIQAPCLLAGRPYTPRASLGLVTLDSPARPADPDVLLHQADLAMYAAKRERTGRLKVYRPDMSPPIATPPPG